ncbi:MAG: FAD-dependent oxidoreductase [Fusobacterium sp.]|nr:FAD-dependent oxidoreductase [Fusobacterium sp.]
MYDVVVVGGGTAGIAAAYTAAKSGLKTLLIEKKIHLGGAITSGLVLPVMNAGKSEINRDFYDELVKKMSENGAQIEFQGNSGWFNPEVLKIVLDEMLTSAGVEIRFLTSISKVEVGFDNNIKKLELKSELLSENINKIYSHNNHDMLRGANAKQLLECIKQIDSDNSSGDSERLSEYIEARYVIDATGNCDVGKICGCNFIENETQPVTLRFIMSGIDMEKFAGWLRSIDRDKEVSPIEEIDGTIHLSTAYTWDKNSVWALRPIFENAIAAGDLTIEDGNYFQVFTVAGCDGALAFNCPRILKNLDLKDVKAVSAALIEARASILRLAAFCKKYFAGFEKAYISNIADDLGIRVSRRIEGRYLYTERDLKEGKRFDNPVLEANYPIDVHSSEQDGSVLNKVGYYQLPIESLMSADIDNLFVAGRCLSADFKAQAALRVQQSCFSMGEAVAKYIKNLIS